jgi:Uma2 family endonuclease
MSRVAERSGLTAAEYLAWEREQPVKHEYFDGDVFARDGGIPRHNALGVGVSATLRAALTGRGCAVLSSDQRVGLSRRERRVRRGAAPGWHQRRPREPQIIVEVLSQGTEQYDRGLKWASYQQLPSLTDYVLVSQSEVRIEHYRREAAGRWGYRAFGAGERLELTNGATLDVDAIFAGIFELPGD